MSFAELPASKQWAGLKYRGQKFAEVWFKPEGQPFALIFRIPRESFQIPGLVQELTMSNLLAAVRQSPAEVESWRHGDVGHSGMDGTNPEFASVVPPPAEADAHLVIDVTLKPPVQAAATESSAPGTASPEAVPATESSEPVTGSVTFEELEARWKAILGLEASIETLRLSMESLMSEMEGALKKTLTMEEKVHALRADLSHWTKEKKRVLDALPKMKDSIHRAVWSLGTPERKRLEALYNENIEPHLPFPQMDQVLKELEALQKTRQVLYSTSQGVYQESRAIATSVHGALRTLQNNAAINAKKKRDAARGGKFFKDIRRGAGL